MPWWAPCSIRDAQSSRCSTCWCHVRGSIGRYCSCAAPTARHCGRAGRKSSNWCRIWSREPRFSCSTTPRTPCRSSSQRRSRTGWLRSSRSIPSGRDKPVERTARDGPRIIPERRRRRGTVAGCRKARRARGLTRSATRGPSLRPGRRRTFAVTFPKWAMVCAKPGNSAVGTAGPGGLACAERWSVLPRTGESHAPLPRRTRISRWPAHPRQ